MIVSGKRAATHRPLYEICMESGDLTDEIVEFIRENGSIKGLNFNGSVIAIRTLWHSVENADYVFDNIQERFGVRAW